MANFAGLLHMTVHSLTKSAIFFAVGHAAQKTGTQLMEDIRGLIRINPTIGWGLMLGTLAILGMPPFGVFASEFLILTTAMQDAPLGDADPAHGAGRGLRRHLRQGAADGLRRDPRQASAASAGHHCPCSCISHGADARACTFRLTWPLVSTGGAADRLTFASGTTR